MRELCPDPRPLKQGRLFQRAVLPLTSAAVPPYSLWSAIIISYIGRDATTIMADLIPVIKWSEAAPSVELAASWLQVRATNVTTTDHHRPAGTLADRRLSAQRSSIR